jgi:hypothetical protein
MLKRFCEITRLQTKRLQMKSFVHPNEMTNDIEVVGHIPKLMAGWVSKFLNRATNSGTVLIKGKRINRGASYGVEVSCKFTFKGDSFSCSWLIRPRVVPRRKEGPPTTHQETKYAHFSLLSKWPAFA